MWIDLRPYLDSSAHNVNVDFSAVDVYNLFRHLGLRHLTVVDGYNRIKGMITRKDLLAHVMKKKIKDKEETEEEEKTDVELKELTILDKEDAEAPPSEASLAPTF